MACNHRRTGICLWVCSCPYCSCTFRRLVYSLCGVIMIVEYYIEQQSFDMVIGCFQIDPLLDKPYWAAVSWWLVPGTFAYE